MEASLRVNVVNVVNVSMPLCAELLRSSRWIVSNDRIDEGSFPMYTPWLGTSAQSGPPSSRHPIVDNVAKSGAPFRYPFHCWSMFMPPRRVLGRLSASSDSSGQCCADSYSPLLRA